MYIPSSYEFEKGYRAFQQYEKRDAMYKTASFLIDHFWGQPSEMADSLGVLLLTWNQAFYRYGPFDFDALEKCISRNHHTLDGYRRRNILSYVPADDESIGILFEQFLSALEICEGKKVHTRSPVAVAKGLHLLAPSFFPLWDNQIARGYDCHYAYNPKGKYLIFIAKIKQVAEKLQGSIDMQATGKTLIKLIDEYNYAKYTKTWI